MRIMLLVSIMLYTIAAPLGVASGVYPTDIVHHPYEVMIWTNYYALVRLHCAGSIIAPHYVLTTARCAYHAKSWGSKVRAGTTTRNYGGSLHRIDQVIIHDDWDEMVLNNIALIRVREPFVYGKTRQKISLSECDYGLRDGTSATVTGWGQAYLLGAVEVTIVDDPEICAKLFPTGFVRGRDVCTMNNDREERGRTSPCYGDSGAPLVVDGYLVAIFSMTYATCGSGDPHGYVGVAYYRDWINERVEYSITDAEFDEYDDPILVLSLKLFTCAAFRNLLW